MQRISPFLWFDGNAEEAANFYTSVFRNSKINQIARYGDNGPGPKGAVMLVAFTLDGQEFFALNGGPIYKFNPAISLLINCDSQDEIDYYWDKLCDGGAPVQCGWLTDKYGVSWQVVPSNIGRLLTGDPERSGRVMSAVMQMVKLDMGVMQRAYDGK